MTSEPTDTTLTAPDPQGTPAGPPGAAPGPRRRTLRLGLAVSQVVLAGLLMTYLWGWVHDLQRLRSLEAEPSPPSKIISKFEAWQRVYQRSAR